VCGVKQPAKPAAHPNWFRYRWLASTALFFALLGLACLLVWPVWPGQTSSQAAATPAPISAALPLAEIRQPTATASASIEQLLAGSPGKNAEDWRVLRLQGNAAVLVIEFPTLLVQGQTFNRAAALLEKTGGLRQQLLTDDELATLLTKAGDNTETFFLGHDYTANGLARFFNQAERQSIALNPQELRLRQLLLDALILKHEAGRYLAQGEQAVISFTSVQLDNPATPQDETVDALRRESILLHELSHGEFFTNPDYQQRSWNYWRKALTEVERRAFRQLLAGMGYDAGNEELMVNETQALLMHTPDERAFGPANLGLNAAQLANLKLRWQQNL
jgi:hypothetical protein